LNPPFKNRSEAELLAIKKKYGATGGILEAEQRIAAIAKDLVRHYLEQIFPGGFKAQVVCHSKLAAIRYQKAIHHALAQEIAKQEASATPDFALLGKLGKLKAAVIISSDGNNEDASVATARMQVRDWNAVKNFCKPFVFDDPENRTVASPSSSFATCCSQASMHQSSK
jgi:type I restriction enzyme R subunit